MQVACCKLHVCNICILFRELTMFMIKIHVEYGHSNKNDVVSHWRVNNSSTRVPCHDAVHPMKYATYFVVGWSRLHYGDVIMGAIASQITSLTIVYSNVYSDADQRKHQSSASLAFVRGTGEFPAQMASNAENVSIWWRHHGFCPHPAGLTTPTKQITIKLCAYFTGRNPWVLFLSTCPHNGLNITVWPTFITEIFIISGKMIYFTDFELLWETYW